MPHFTRAQARQNAAFLAALRRTGNARRAAAELGVHRATYTKRRAKSAAFAQEWDAALTFAHASLEKSAPERGGGPPAKPVVEGSRAQRALRTSGGEPCVVRSAKTGRLQLRRAPPGRMTTSAEQAFLSALARGASVRLAAVEAGFAHSSFYSRARADRAFALAMKAALALGADRLELAALEACDRFFGGEAGDWLEDAAEAPLLVFDADRAIQLLHYGRKRHEALRAGGRIPTPMDAEEAGASVMRMVDAVRRADAGKPRE